MRALASINGTGLGQVNEGLDAVAFCVENSFKSYCFINCSSVLHPRWWDTRFHYPALGYVFDQRLSRLSLRSIGKISDHKAKLGLAKHRYFVIGYKYHTTNLMCVTKLKNIKSATWFLHINTKKYVAVFTVIHIAVELIQDGTVPSSLQPVIEMFYASITRRFGSLHEAHVSCISAF